MNKLNLIIKPDNILFFDLDGTLVNTDYANYLSYKKAIQSVMGAETNISYNPNKRFNRDTLKSQIPNLTEFEYEKIIFKKEQYYKDYLYLTKVNMVIVNVLLQYYKTHITVLVTNCHQERVFLTLNYYGLNDKFSCIFYRQPNSTNHIRNKYDNAISYLNISTNSIIIFENEKSEIDNAILAGIRTQNIITI